jgi:hypothetical protein
LSFPSQEKYPAKRHCKGTSNMAAPKAPTPVNAIDHFIKQNEAPQEPIAPPHVIATFEGTVYKAANGGKGRETAQFKAEVKIPLSAVANTDFTPVSLFRKYYAQKALMEIPGVNVSIQRANLTQVEGALPLLPFDHELHWTANREALLDMCKRYGKKQYVAIDLMDDKPKSKAVELRPELYPTAQSLRNALRRIQEEPEAFDREQGKLAARAAGIPAEMEAEIAQLV